MSETLPEDILGIVVHHLEIPELFRFMLTSKRLSFDWAATRLVSFDIVSPFTRCPSSRRPTPESTTALQKSLSRLIARFVPSSEGGHQKLRHLTVGYSCLGATLEKDFLPLVPQLKGITIMHPDHLPLLAHMNRNTIESIRMGYMAPKEQVLPGLRQFFSECCPRLHTISFLKDENYFEQQDVTIAQHMLLFINEGGGARILPSLTSLELAYIHHESTKTYMGPAIRLLKQGGQLQRVHFVFYSSADFRLTFLPAGFDIRNNLDLDAIVDHLERIFGPGNNLAIFGSFFWTEVFKMSYVVHGNDAFDHCRALYNACFCSVPAAHPDVIAAAYNAAIYKREVKKSESVQVFANWDRIVDELAAVVDQHDHSITQRGLSHIVLVMSRLASKIQVKPFTAGEFRTGSTKFVALLKRLLNQNTGLLVRYSHPHYRWLYLALLRPLELIFEDAEWLQNCNINFNVKIDQVPILHYLIRRPAVVDILLDLPNVDAMTVNTISSKDETLLSLAMAGDTGMHASVFSKIIEQYRKLPDPNDKRRAHVENLFKYHLKELKHLFQDPKKLQAIANAWGPNWRTLLTEEMLELLGNTKLVAGVRDFVFYHQKARTTNAVLTGLPANVAIELAEIVWREAFKFANTRDKLLSAAKRVVEALPIVPESVLKFIQGEPVPGLACAVPKKPFVKVLQFIVDKAKRDSSRQRKDDESETPSKWPRRK
eukprot:TRINITY_DN13348_c0_g1_i1.p1 TRINITY_DN13348_c0_g1~~TRINITY_DN13348_c0_g1_i1.p1  ORF type:complete len:711 (+),score=123.66 TRINITY_DN13348_c0_g1_i1:87-2219(+)